MSEGGRERKEWKEKKGGRERGREPRTILKEEDRRTYQI